MKKLFSLILVLGLSSALILSTGPVMAGHGAASDEGEDYDRLYNEFLDRLQNQRGGTGTPSSTPAPAPAPTPAPAPVSTPEPVVEPKAEAPKSISATQISISGRVVNDGGSYFIRADRKTYYRVYGQQQANAVADAVRYESAEVRGVPVYNDNGGLVGISARQVIPGRLSPNAKKTPAPAPAKKVTPPSRSTAPVTWTGRLYNDGGKVTIVPDGKGISYAVTGKDNARAILQGTTYPRAEVTGIPFYNAEGHLVGISARSVTRLAALPKPKIVQPAEIQSPRSQSQTFRGEIEIKDGNPYLLMKNSKGKTVSYPLLNEVNWRQAFDYAYSGTVTVEGVKNDKGVIRYYDIY